MGNYVPPGDSLVSAVVTGTVVLVGQGTGGVTPELIVLAVLLLLPLAYAAQRMDMHLMAGNDALSDGAMEDAKNDRLTEIEKKHLHALGKMYLLSFVFILICTALAVAVLGLVYPRLPQSLLTALGFLYFVFPILIIAVVLHAIKVRFKEVVFALLFAAVVFAVQWTHGF
jgi:mannose/fructose/N-acetylgalactosamine-specific phosphotransferase system component IIC